MFRPYVRPFSVSAVIVMRCLIGRNILKLFPVRYVKSGKKMFKSVTWLMVVTRTHPNYFAMELCISQSAMSATCSTHVFVLYLIILLIFLQQ
jgi:hypothetical protein